MGEVSKHCFYMLHKGAYKVHLISGSLILQTAVAITFVLTDICSDLSFCPSKMTITTKTKCYYSEMETYSKVILFYY